MNGFCFFFFFCQNPFQVCKFAAKPIGFYRAFLCHWRQLSTTLQSCPEELLLEQCWGYTQELLKYWNVFAADYCNSYHAGGVQATCLINNVVDLHTQFSRVSTTLVLLLCQTWRKRVMPSYRWVGSATCSSRADWAIRRQVFIRAHSQGA